MATEQNVFPVVAVIPSLNPDPKLAEVTEELLRTGFSNVIVVDDGSREDCQYVFSGLEALDGCTVLHHEVNRGKGAALKTASAYYLEHFDTSRFLGIVTADADGQHLPEDIYRCAQALVERPETLILGTRDFDAPDVPFKSRRGNKLTTFFFQLLYGKRVNDVMTGLRAIPNALVREGLEIRSDRFEFETKMLISAVTQKADVAEVIIRTVYFDNNRETHFHPVKDSIRIYKILFASFFKFACSALGCVLVDQGLFAVLQKLVFAALKPELSIPLSTLLARAGSSALNYTLNRNVVFEKRASVRSSLARYYILCVCQAAASALGVTALYALTRWDTSVLKLIVDTLLFFASYRIQRAWVFREEKKG